MTYRDLDNDLMKYAAFQTLVSRTASAERGRLLEASLGLSQFLHSRTAAPPWVSEAAWQPHPWVLKHLWTQQILAFPSTSSPLLPWLPTWCQ